MSLPAHQREIGVCFCLPLPSLVKYHYPSRCVVAKLANRSVFCGKVSLIIQYTGSFLLRLVTQNSILLRPTYVLTKPERRCNTMRSVDQLMSNRVVFKTHVVHASAVSILSLFVMINFVNLTNYNNIISISSGYMASNKSRVLFLQSKVSILQGKP